MSQEQHTSASADVYEIVLGAGIVIDEIVQTCHESGLSFDPGLTRGNFPLRHLREPHAEQRVTIEIIDPGCRFSVEEGLKYLRATGLERPTDEHALRFAEQCGKVTDGKKPLIIFLHKPWQDPENRYQYVICVRRPPETRLLGLYCPEDGFHNECVLAGVRLCG